MAVVVKSIGRLGSTPTLQENDLQFFANMATEGALITSNSPQVAAARALDNNGNYKWGFDIATRVANGTSKPDEYQNTWRDWLMYGNAGPSRTAGSRDAQRGYDVAQALQHGITKAVAAREANAIAAQPANVGAGMLLANGIIGSTSTSDVKAGIIANTLGDAGAKQGASDVLDNNSGFFTKVLKFFGLA